MTKSGNGRGTLILDKRFARPGYRAIGRVQRASGTKSKRLFAAINAMLDHLYTTEQYEPIEAIRDRRLQAVDVYTLYLANRLQEITPTSTGGMTLLEQWQAWEDRTESIDTRRQRALARKKITALLPAGALTTSLPGVMRSLKAELQEKKPTFNRSLAAAQAFVRDTVGTLDRLHALVTDVGYYVDRHEQRAAPTVAQALQVRDALQGPAASLWWDLCLTGMGPKEFDGAWEHEGEALQIHGTKRAGRVRTIPALGSIERRPMGWKSFRTQLVAATTTTIGEKPHQTVVQTIRPIGFEVYDTRRFFRHLLELARIPQIRTKLYMGHALGSVTDRYGMVEVREFLPEDRQAILAVVQAAEAKHVAGRRGAMRTA